MKQKFTKYRVVFGAILMAFLLSACNDNGNPIKNPDAKVGSLYVLNEGNWGVSNSEITVYNPENNSLANDFFSSANEGAPLGDIPTSISFYDAKAYVTLSNSGKIFVIDPVSGKLLGKILDLESPRYMARTSEQFAYVSSLTKNKIEQVDIINNKKVFEFNLPQGCNAEQFVVKNPYVFTNCWSYGQEILKIDSRTNQVVKSVKVGVQPMCLFVDAKDNLWTMTDGGYFGNPIGYEDPKLICLDQNLNIIKSFTIKRSSSAIMHKMAMEPKGEAIYFLNGDLYKMHIDDTELPNSSYMDCSKMNVYALTVDPSNGDLYVADAVDFSQNGSVFRYDSKGKLLHTFKAGINPGGFFFRLIM